MTTEPTTANPEIGRSIAAGGIATNYHDLGSGPPVLMIHGSGPGVSAWANWRLNLPELSRHFRVVAPDMVGFGFTERPDGLAYGKETWLRHLAGFLDALGLSQVDIVGNSFGGGLAIAFAARHPERVRRLVLMGSVGVEFTLTPGLDAVWGYEPSPEAMRNLLRLFAFNSDLATSDLAELRFRASTRPGFQEAFSAMFPGPRQRHISALATDEAAIAALQQSTLILHGREDQVIPMHASLRLFELIGEAELHVFGRCGHWVQIEHTRRFNRLVADFLS